MTVDFYGMRVFCFTWFQVLEFVDEIADWRLNWDGKKKKQCNQTNVIVETGMMVVFTRVGLPYALYVIFTSHSMWKRIFYMSYHRLN